MRLNDVPCAITFSLVLEQCWWHPRWSESNLEPMQSVAWMDRSKRKPQVLPMKMMQETSNNNYHRITWHINAVSWFRSHSSELLSHRLNILRWPPCSEHLISCDVIAWGTRRHRTSCTWALVAPNVFQQCLFVFAKVTPQWPSGRQHHILTKQLAR